MSERLTPADIIEVYDSRDDANRTAKEWRESRRVAACRVVKRTVRAFGVASEVHVVCVWYTQASKVHGWNG